MKIIPIIILKWRKLRFFPLGNDICSNFFFLFPVAITPFMRKGRISWSRQLTCCVRKGKIGFCQSEQIFCITISTPSGSILLKNLLLQNASPLQSPRNKSVAQLIHRIKKRSWLWKQEQKYQFETISLLIYSRIKFSMQQEWWLQYLTV